MCHVSILTCLLKIWQPTLFIPVSATVAAREDKQYLYAKLLIPSAIIDMTQRNLKTSRIPIRLYTMGQKTADTGNRKVRGRPGGVPHSVCHTNDTLLCHIHMWHIPVACCTKRKANIQLWGGPMIQLVCYTAVFSVVAQRSSPLVAGVKRGRGRGNLSTRERVGRVGLEP